MKTPSAGVVYYTDNCCDKRILKKAQEKLLSAAGNRPIISVSLKPIDFGQNVVMPLRRSNLTMFKQMLTGLQTIDTDVVFFCEHDIIYHNSHFDFIPPEKDKFYYNQNIWKINSETGQTLFYYLKQTCCVCAWRQVAIDHYRNRVDRVEKEGFTRRMGYEPGTHKFPRGFDQYESGVYFSKYPLIDIRHTGNLTGKRFKKEQYRNQRLLKGWTLADEIPYWGKTKNRFWEFLNEI
jgi:hypothetical protein